MNKSDLFYKLDAYRTNTEKARRIAVNGYLHAMKFHRAANLGDYIFRTLHTKELLASGQSHIHHIPYRNTGYDMRNEALRRQKLFDDNQQKNPLALLSNEYASYGEVPVAQ
jgi:hypothetical protein